MKRNLSYRTRLAILLLEFSTAKEKIMVWAKIDILLRAKTI